MKPMSLVQAAVAAAMILGRTPLTFANGGLVMMGASDSSDNFYATDLFAKAASTAWTRAAPNMCREFETYMQEITSCDGLDLDVQTSTLDIQTGTPPTTTVGVALPTIVLHGSWEYFGDLTNTATGQKWHNPQCAVDITLNAGFFFPFRIAIAGSLLYQPAGIVAQVGRHHRIRRSLVRSSVASRLPITYRSGISAPLSADGPVEHRIGEYTDSCRTARTLSLAREFS